MSSYRPKSLDELNSRYDQAMSADLAIKKGVSGIRESENLQKEKRAVPDFDSMETDAHELSKKVAGTKNVEDISGAVDDFIRHLNSEYSPKSLSANRPQPNKVVNPQPKTHAVPQPKNPAPVQPEPFSENRSELLDNYMKVMTDQYEDDDDDSEPSAVGGYLKKKNRKRRRDKISGQVEERHPVNPPAVSEPMPLPEVNYNDSDYMSKPDEVLPQDNTAEDSRSENIADSSFESLESTFNRLDEQAKKSKSTKKKKGAARIVFRTIFSLLLAAVLVFTAAVASLVLVLKVNTGNLALDKYYFVTTTADFEEAGLNKGDLVVCETGENVEDGSFVLCVDRNAGSFFFGKKNGGVVDDQGNIMYLVDGQNVYKDSVLGTVGKSIGHVGSVIDFIFRYYIPVLGALLILAIALILVVSVALRNKNKKAGEITEEDEQYIKYEDGEQDEDDATDSEAETEAEPEAEPQEETEAEPLFEDETQEPTEDSDVPERKSRKKDRKKKNKKNKNRRKQEAEENSESDNEAVSDETEDSYGSDYNSFSDI
ncbi:MAG: hypothetical protein ACI4SB_02115 [Acutalibacteraceae bacterium]